MRTLCLLLALQACAAPPKPRSSLRVVTWNIRAGDYGLDGLVETLRELDGDIVALQEVDRRVRRTGNVDQPARLAAATGMQVAFRRHFRCQGGDYGVALLSRFPIDGVTRHSTPRSNLALLSARVMTSDGPVYIINVHFHPVNPLDDAEVIANNRAAQHREAMTALQLARRLPATTLIVGDMNAPSGSRTWETFEADFEDACDGAAWSKTWPAAFPLTRIYYIWVARRWKPTIVNCFAASSDASDHLPVVVDLNLKGAPGQ